MEQTRLLFHDGDIDRENYYKLKNEEEKSLLRVYAPDYDEASEAGKMVGDFGSLWQPSSVARRNAWQRQCRLRSR